MMFKKCTMQVSFEALNRLFDLPEEVTVVGVQQTQLPHSLLQINFISTLDQDIPEVSVDIDKPLSQIGKAFREGTKTLSDKGSVRG